MKAFEIVTEKVKFRLSMTDWEGLPPVTFTVETGAASIATYLTYEEAAALGAGFMTATSPAAFEPAEGGEAA